MIEQNAIQLDYSCILNVPLQTYNEDFYFIVNGQEFKTNRLISNLLSPKISKIHLNDPIVDRIKIDTKQKGDFQHILNLIDFKSQNIPENEVPFFLEVLDFLDTESIHFSESSNSTKITVDNVFTLIKQHEKYGKIFSDRLNTEIEFASTHFSELCEAHIEEIKKLNVSTVFEILRRENLNLENEDQLLKFINGLYLENSEYTILYECVDFLNVTANCMSDFLSIFEIDDMTRETWQKLQNRLKGEILNAEKKSDNRYKEKVNQYSYSKGKEFSGIINYLRTKSLGKIDDELEITASSCISKDENCLPSNVALFEDQNKSFISSSAQNNWLCFNFKKHLVMPTNYTIRTNNWWTSYKHPKSWVIECSNDNNSWEVVDDVNECSELKGSGLVHTFNIKKQSSNFYKYIRIRLTGNDWNNYNYLVIDSFEIFGTLK